MNETLTDLALEYGWGCPRCKGGTSARDDVEYERHRYRCPDCHGNRVTPSDAEEFERLVAALPSPLTEIEAVLSKMTTTEEWPLSRLAPRLARLATIARQSLDSLQRTKAVTP